MLKNHVDLDHRCNSPPGVKLHPPVTLGRHPENFSSETLTRSSLTKKFVWKKFVHQVVSESVLMLSSCCPPNPTANTTVVVSLIFLDVAEWWGGLCQTFSGKTFSQDPPGVKVRRWTSDRKNFLDGPDHVGSVPSAKNYLLLWKLAPASEKFRNFFHAGGGHRHSVGRRSRLGQKIFDRPQPIVTSSLKSLNWTPTWW